ncbi:aryl-alcohol dehydrogenase [Aspergillus bombycis]|uniref:Aryl-alcohol dehydrogenase n=1 Tax=Aspergillus bombycis TaxID=109264 RepID=A0A1F8A402_9EURO|nr:aryl-alcohol dehydrogenase [Aspergillus bombycis]OGM46444.1 aryl-alcohol dehydrogenase [Aspergillus bombycis]
MIASEQPYNFIIVSAGVGGLVLASRLCEDATANVLLVEAGPNHMGDLHVETPGLLGAMFGDPDFDWNYLTEPQRSNQVHANNRQMGQPRGWIVSSFSALNFSIVAYPSHANFEAWESLDNDGWEPDAMAPYLRKFHTYTPPSETTSALLSLDQYMKADNQGNQGPVPVCHPDVYTPFNQTWNETPPGICWGLLRPGRRTAQKPHLFTETMVERVALTKSDDGQVTATGVQIQTKDGEQLAVSATREVFISAGTLNSPQLLDLSGIGAADLLKKHSIPVVLDLPGVGENLQDHRVVQPLVELYEKTRPGPLTGMPYLDSPQVEQFSPGRQQQYNILRQMLRDDQTGSAQYMFLNSQVNVKPGVSTMAYALSKDLPENYISIMALLNHPFSRGSIHIRSANPGEKHVYDPKYLSHPLDLEVLARHTQFLDRIAGTQPFSSLLKPGARVPEAAVDLADLEKAKEVVKDCLFHDFHPVGTYAVMPADLGGVVDPQLKMHGTRNLRVVDASIFPLETSGNIQAMTYAVAERATDMIRSSAHH